MRRALAGELLKVRSTRMWWGLLLGLVVLVLLQAGLTAAISGQPPGPGAPELPGLDSAAGLRAALSSGFQGGYLMALVLGTIIGAVDFRHRTATQTFLSTPHRGLVVAAKAGAAAVFGLMYAMVAQVLAVIMVLLVALIRGLDVNLTDSSVLRSLALGLVGIVVWCLIGVMLGVLLRNQIAAVLIAVGFVFVVEPLLILALNKMDLETVAQYTIGNASSALVEGFSGGALLPWWGGGLVMVGYAAVIGALGWVLTVRRDVT